MLRDRAETTMEKKGAQPNLFSTLSENEYADEKSEEEFINSLHQILNIKDYSDFKRTEIQIADESFIPRLKDDLQQTVID